MIMVGWRMAEVELRAIMKCLWEFAAMPRQSLSPTARGEQGLGKILDLLHGPGLELLGRSSQMHEPFFVGASHTCS